MNRRIAPVIVIVAAGLLLSGCQKSEPTAQSDWVINLSANPATIPLGNSTRGTTEISARVYDKAGVPQTNIGVAFSTSVGSMASAGTTVRTDSTGLAKDTLSTAGDATVTATSGSISKTLDVKVGGKNTSPTAGAALTPSGQATVGTTVTFSSASSSDAEDGVVSWSHWEISSSNPEAGIEYDQWTTAQAIQIKFTQPQHLDVRLSVGDHWTTSYYDTRTPPPAGTSGVGWLADAITYEIVANQAPTAKINGTTFAGQVRQATDGSGTYLCAVSMSGCASSDPAPGQVVTWEWNWQDRTEQYTTCLAQHTYTGLTATTEYTVNLIVYDNGDGTCGPRGTGADTCTTRGVSNPASALVTCTVPATTP